MIMIRDKLFYFVIFDVIFDLVKNQPFNFINYVQYEYNFLSIVQMFHRR